MNPKQLAAAIAAAVAALILTACGDAGGANDAASVSRPSAQTPAAPAAPQPAAPAPRPTPPPPPAPAPAAEPFTYGDDPYLDRLWDDCSAGDMLACEDLYWESPVGSEYEDFGWNATMGTDEAITALALDGVWQDMTLSERSEICLGVNIFGVRQSAETINDGADGTLHLGTIVEFLDSVCG